MAPPRHTYRTPPRAHIASGALNRLGVSGTAHGTHATQLSQVLLLDQKPRKLPISFYLWLWFCTSPFFLPFYGQVPLLVPIIIVIGGSTTTLDTLGRQLLVFGLLGLSPPLDHPHIVGLKRA